MTSVVGPQVLVGIYNYFYTLLHSNNVVGPQVLVGIYNSSLEFLSSCTVVGPQVLVGIYNCAYPSSMSFRSCRTSGFGRYLSLLLVVMPSL